MRWFCILLAALALAAGKPTSNATPWAFRPLTNPTPPTIADAAWSRDDLDRFIRQRLDAEQLAPNADADRLTLIRRVSFTLTGLAPTTKEIADFVNDRSNDDPALAKVVDRYLASERFGERWARHWLDIVRYADSAGRTYNPPFTYAWRYRDYVIDAYNADKPFDRFVSEQLAGDLLPAKTIDERRRNLIATGLLALGSHDLQGLSREGFFMDAIDDQIDVTSRALFGLTISCARCHDHKYDPVSMRDYYALAGIFYSTRILAGTPYRGEGNGYVDHEQLVTLPASLAKNAARPALTPGVHSMDDFNAVWSTGERKIRYATDPHLAMGVLDEEQPEDCAIRIKGDAHERGPAPPRGALQIKGLPPLTTVPRGASGRLEYARWITSPKHPLTARVYVNRVWSHLLGQGLAPGVDDFGVMSEPPSHPELLDHLASRFIAEGWSTKRLIRQIVLSRTYRQSSAVRVDGEERDPQNLLHWRASLRRLEWEPLRDTLLQISGQLQTSRPEGVQVAGIGGKSMKTAVSSLLEIDDPYRTIYLPVLRSRVPESFSTFDFPDPCQIQGRREVTTVAPQALFFMNSRFVSDCAEGVVEQMAREARPSEAERIRWLYQRVLSRLPESVELREAGALVRGVEPPQASTADLYRWSILTQALLASAEFRYLR